MTAREKDLDGRNDGASEINRTIRTRLSSVFEGQAEMLRI